jgi:hypothetical protein
MIYINENNNITFNETGISQNVLRDNKQKAENKNSQPNKKKQKDGI